MRPVLPYLLLVLLLHACVSPEQDPFRDLRAGSWVEAKGDVLDGHPVVREVAELDRAESDTGDKMEETEIHAPGLPHFRSPLV